MGETDPWSCGNLPAQRPSLELANDLVHLAESGRADRLAVGDASAVGVDRDAAVGLGGALGEQFLLLAVPAQARFGEVDDLRPAVGVLQLRDGHLGRVDTGGGERRGSRIDARAVVRLGREPRGEHLERSEPAGTQRHRREPHRTFTHITCAVATGEDEGDRSLARRAEHRSGQRGVDRRRGEYLVLGERSAPPGGGAGLAVAQRAHRDPGQRPVGDRVLVLVTPGLHGEVLGGDHEAGPAVPVPQPVAGRIGVERATRVLVEPDDGRHVGVPGPQRVRRGRQCHATSSTSIAYSNER